MGKTDPAVADEVGYSTLQTISSAGRFNHWMYETIAPYCSGKILEIGGGIGNISSFFLEAGQDLTVTELHEEYCTLVRERLSKQPTLRDVITMDITDPNFDLLYQKLFGEFDTLFALNVIEHIEDRDLALSNCRKLLKPGGHLIILVPAFQSLYNRFDTELVHYLRFTKKSLQELVERNQFSLLQRKYFNFTGIFGWWLTGSILRRKIIPEGQMKLYDRLVPLFRLIDLVASRFAGLSVIIVAQK